MIYMIDYSPLFLYPPFHNLGNKNWFYKLLQADIGEGGGSVNNMVICG